MKKLDDNFEDIFNDLKMNEKNYDNINLNNNCNSILNKLNNIFNTLKDYYNSSSEEISNYISFINSFSSQIIQINNIVKESHKKLKNNIYNNNFFDQFDNYNISLTEKFYDLSSQMQRSIISPFNIYKEKYNSENNIILNKFKKILEKIKSENNYLYEIKREYEEEKNKYENENENEKKIKYKEKMEEKIELYKYKINEINLSLMVYKIEINNILEVINNKQKVKNQSIKNTINNYFDIMDNFFIKSNNDIKIYKNKIDDINDSLKNVQFITNIKFSIEKIYWEIDDKNDEKEKNKNKVNKITNNTIKNLNNKTNSNSNYNEDPNNNQIISSKTPKNYINNFMSKLFEKENFKENEAAEFLIFLSEDNINFEVYSYLCNCFYRYKKNNRINTIKEFQNLNNFTHFSNILNLMIEELSNNNNANNTPKNQYDRYLLLDKIICIGEESVCDNIFICSLLSNNKKLKNESLWFICITYKLISDLNKLCENYYSSTLNSKNKIIGIVKQLLGKINIGVDKKSKNIINDFIIQKGFDKFIPHYNNLSSQIKENICKNEIPKLIHNILKNYISHMSNYNYPLEGSYKLIEGIYYEYFKSKAPELMNFYINYSIASTFSVRRNIPIKNLGNNNNKSEELKRKIKEIKMHNYLVENTKLFDIENINNKYLILKNTLVFLKNKEKIKLINLNTSLYEFLRKDIYHYILLNLKSSSFNNNEHIQIWKCFLKCSSIYKRTGFENTNYESIIKDIFTKDIVNGFKNDINAIKLDIPRSPFKQDFSSASKAIKHILYAFIYINNLNNKNEKINYYQGMNYIATFLYEMIHNEEDCLLLLSGLFYSTEYSDIFSAQMQKLQKYLYVVEGLVYLYLPKIYSHLIDNNLELNFFVNPIFISLFTNIYSSLPENDFSFLLEIWDDFILNGWKTIFIDVLAILKQNENKILNLYSEDLMKYLSNGITNGEMFTIYNYDEFKKEKNKFKPTNQLLEIISKESSLEEELKK